MDDIFVTVEIPDGYFKNRYNLKGKDWLRMIPEEEKDIFVHCGLQNAGYGKLGGRARAATAKRDKRGRFIKDV